jgi:phospho-N-acetylmuramoyl-pentapeptide-transferase
MLDYLLACATSFAGVAGTIFLGKHIVQPISTALPGHSHKAGTPTFGGISIYFSFLITALIFKNSASLMILIITICFIIGAADDIRKVSSKSNRGLGKSSKLVLLLLPLLCTFLLSGNSYWLAAINTSIVLFFAAAFDISDGLDGLAALLSLATLLASALIEPRLGRTILTLSGSVIGFLFFNLGPAKIFMGDSGSLMIGGFIGTIFILSGYDYRIILLSSVPIINLASVGLRLAQIYTNLNFLKLVKFKAPLHHHLEDRVGESRTVILLTSIAAVIGILILFIASYF